MKHYDWDHLQGSYHVVCAAIYILDCITHGEVEKFYEHSGVFTLQWACIDIRYVIQSHITNNPTCAVHQLAIIL
jgi:hypothetical protein